MSITHLYSQHELLSICGDISSFVLSPWVVVQSHWNEDKKKSIKTCYFDNPDVNPFLINIIKANKCLPRPMSTHEHEEEKEIIPHARNYRTVKYEFLFPIFDDEQRRRRC